MAAKRYRVMVFTGVKRLDMVRQIGWFASFAHAEASCERERLSSAPTEREWAVVAPPDEEIPMQSPERDA
jgi:hypothetical protein